MGSVYSRLSGVAFGDIKNAMDQDPANRVKLETEFTTPARIVPQHILIDPRSATLGIERTPIIINTKEKDEKESEPEETSKPLYLETDLDELSALTNIISTPVSVKRKKTVEALNISQLKISDESTIDELVEGEIEKKEDCKEETLEKTEIKDSDPIDKPIEPKILTTDYAPILCRGPLDWIPKKKAMFLTPQNNIKTKSGRTPLARVCTNSPISPITPGNNKVIQDGVESGFVQLMGTPNSKQWRGFREERLRLGLDDPENTPPWCLGVGAAHPPDVIQSAPGKVMRQTKTAWDQDSSFII